MKYVRLLVPYVLVVLIATGFVWQSQADARARHDAAVAQCEAVNREHDTIRDILDHLIVNEAPLPSNLSPELQALILQGRKSAQEFHDFAVTRLGPRADCSAL